jgi:hypothetical protein
MFTSHHHTVEKNHYIKVANKSFENAAKSITSERKQQIKIAFTKKLRAD